MQCEGKIAIVTGAAGKGIGRSAALTLAREGARIAVNSREGGRSAQPVVNHIKEAGGEAIEVAADVMTAEGCRTLVETALGCFGRVDICVINPGAGWHPEPMEALNVVGALDDVRREVAPIYHLMPLLLPGMFERKWGRLVAVGVESYTGPPSYAYKVAKAARAKAMLLGAADAWSKGVTLNVVAPGPVSGIESLEEAVEHCNHGDAWTGRKAISPQDVAEGIVFLCSDAAKYISGCELPYRF